jgi:hypothetical protein
MYRLFHLKRNPNYNSICKFWWLQYKRDELFFSVCLLRRTYRTALQQMSTTFMKTQKHFLCPEMLLPVSVLLSYSIVAQPLYPRGSKSRGSTPTPFCILWWGKWMCYFPIPFSRSCLSSVCPTIIKKMKT